MHGAEPVLDLYVPMAHSEQAPTMPVLASPVYPALHAQLAALVSAVKACVEWAGQLVQIADPLSGLYSSFAQARHPTSPRPVKPGLHVQSLACDAPAADVESLVQIVI